VVLLKNFFNIFKIPELLRRILFTLGVLIIYRIGAFIPAIGVNSSVLIDYLSRASLFKGFLSYFDTFSGGSLERCTIFGLGINPYIMASIIMQVLSITVPYFEQLSKEGDYGRKLISQYTRYLALFLAIGYSFAYGLSLINFNYTAPGLLASSGLAFIFIFTLSLTVGAMFVMWLGEQISLFGIGNGSSMIIFAGIVSRFPDYIVKLFTVHPIKMVLAILVFLITSAFIVFLEKGDRKIPVQYARRIIGNKIYGGQSSYIPFKINTVGVMPVIFATSVLNIPTFLFGLLSSRFEFALVISNALKAGGFLYSTLEFALIIFFTFLYTSFAINPVELADNMKKSGGFVPGIRPGKQTMEYFDFILTRIGLVGAIYLGLLAIIPTVLTNLLSLPFSLGGTSLLIMVSVALETSAQIESYLIEHRYEGFLSVGRLKSR